MSEIEDLTAEIEKLTDAIKDNIKFTQAVMVQRSELWKELQQMKTYLRIIVDNYQKDAGIELIKVRD